MSPASSNPGPNSKTRFNKQSGISIPLRPAPPRAAEEAANPPSPLSVAADKKDNDKEATRSQTSASPWTKNKKEASEPFLNWNHDQIVAWAETTWAGEKEVILGTIKDKQLDGQMLGNISASPAPKDADDSERYGLGAGNYDLLVEASKDFNETSAAVQC